MTLNTITSNHRDLQQVSIRLAPDLACITPEYYAIVEQRIENAIPGARWLDLDRLLVNLWESRATRIKVMYHQPELTRAKAMKDWAMHLLPELTKRGIVDLVEEH